MAIFPFILLKDKKLKEDLYLINHEKIHIRQQLELLIFPFFIWYSLEYFIRLIQYKDRIVAYQNISFEKEAYANDKNLNYLNERKLYSFFNYL